MVQDHSNIERANLDRVQPRSRGVSPPVRGTDRFLFLIQVQVKRDVNVISDPKLSGR